MKDSLAILRSGQLNLWRLTLAVLVGSIASLSTVALMGVSAWMLSRASQHPPVVEISLGAVAVRTFSLTRAGGRYFERLASHDVAFRFLRDLRTKLYEQSITKSVDTATLVSSITRDVETFADVLVRGVSPILACTLSCAAAVIFAFLLSPTAGTILLAAILVTTIAIPRAVLPLRRKITERLSNERNNFDTNIMHTLDALPHLLMNGKVLTATDQISNIERSVSKNERCLSLLAGSEAALIVATSGLVMASLLWVGVDFALGELVASIALVGLVTIETTSMMGPALQSFQESQASAKRILNLINLPVASEKPITTHKGYDIQLPNYRLDVKEGAKLAIIGPSGSGKTTLARIIAGFIPTSKGQYILGNTDASLLTGEQIRRQVVLVEHNAHIFSDSVRNNLRLGKPDATDEELLNVLTGLRLPLQLNARVGEGGIPLSGGEQQRLCIARGLLAKPDVLILDEPTAHLNAELADAVVSYIMQQSHKTVIFITHDLTHATRFDQVIEMPVTTAPVAST